MRPRPIVVWVLLAGGAVSCVTPTALPDHSTTESTPTQAPRSPPVKPATSQTPTVVKWAVDALSGHAEPCAFEQFYDGPATALRVLALAGGLVVVVPPAA